MKGVYLPTLQVGPMGVGKSQIMKQIADELGYKLIDLRLAQQESGDLIGLPYKNGDSSTHWAKPEWWPKEGEKCIVFLDELNRAPNDVRQAVFQLVLDRRLHTHILPKDCYVHAAVNPDNGNYQVETLDPAMIRRFCSIVVEPDVDTWLAWAKGDGKIDNHVSEFVNVNRGLLFHAEEIKLDVKPTPDSYRMLDMLLKAGVVSKENQMEIFKGLLGNEGSVAFCKWMDKNYKRPVSGTEVLTHYEQVKEKVIKQEIPETTQTVTDLIALLKNKKTMTDIETKNLSGFFLDIKKESRAALIQLLPIPVKEILIRDPKIAKILLDIIGDQNG